MKDTFHTQITLIADCNNGTLEEYPKTSKYTMTFDATDATIAMYVQQFRLFLKLCGFADKTIEDFLGEEY